METYWEKLWAEHTLIMDNQKEFVDSHILDKITGIKINNRQREIQ